MFVQSERGNQYYYDDATGQIIHIKDEAELAEAIKKYRLLNSEVHYSRIDPASLKKFLFEEGNGFKQLILEITNACNMRCRYCIYSEYYPQTRTHGSEMMSLETAQKAVDYFFDNYEIAYRRNPTKHPMISFYGGEPLLDLQRLTDIVGYINMNYSEYEPEYNLTTNGLFFNEEAQDFLVENEFNILVSLDGNKENHDRNRLDSLGKPTFDRVISNIDRFKERYPDYSITVSTCFDYKTNLEEMAKFFDDHSLMVTNIAQIQASNSTYYSQFTKEDRVMEETYRSLKERFFEEAKNNTLKKDSFLYRYFGSMFAEFSYHPMGYELPSKVRPYTATCIPGEKLYVAVDGSFKVCEKINSSFCVGNVEDGLDYAEIAKILNTYFSNIKNRCADCKIRKLCKMCFKDFDKGSGFSAEEKICENYKERIKGMLTDYVNLMEINPTLFEEITSDYYKLVSKIGELV